MKKFLKWWLIAFLAIAAINIYGSMAGAQKVHVTRQTIGHMVPSHAGSTECSVRGIEIKIHSLMDTSAVYHILIHEFTHVQQILRFGDCDQMITRYRSDPQFRADIEIEAYCMDIAAWKGKTPDLRAQAIDLVASSHYLPRFGSYANFKRRVERKCREVVQDKNLIATVTREARREANLLLGGGDASRSDSLPQPP